MITKTIKFRGMKQPLTFLTEGDTIKEGDFHYWTFRDNKSYNQMVLDTIEHFKVNGVSYGGITHSGGDNVNEHPERVYFRL